MCSERVFLIFYGAQESIPPAYVAWRAGTTTLFLLGSLFLASIDCSKIPALVSGYQKCPGLDMQ